MSKFNYSKAEKAFDSSLKKLSDDHWKNQILSEKGKEAPLKQESTPLEGSEEENEKQVTKERKKHVHKRFNIKEGWLPLK